VSEISEDLKQTGLTQEQYELARVFPGVMHFTLEQQRLLNRDTHSLFHGERVRTRNLVRYLRQESREIEPRNYPPDVVHHTMLRAFHDFFVGDPLRPEQKRGCPYRGGPEDFKHNVETFQHAMLDVDDVYAHLRRLLPEELLVNGKYVRLRERLVVDPDVQMDDPLELLRLTRTKDTRIRHQARCRLILAQACFEGRRDGFKPEDLEAEARANHTFLRRNFFAGPEGEPVHVVAELDPEDRYVCRRHRVLSEGEPVPEPREDLAVIALHRQEIPMGHGRPTLKIFFFIRHKQRMLLKMLDKHIRFTQLVGIGDPIATMFVVEREDLDAVVNRVREVFVPSPGMVTDANSSIGYRLGSEPLDPKNKRSSNLYEAMKYVSRLWDRPVEVQFLPLAAWINARFSRSRARHDAYKMTQALATAFPALFPEAFTDIPWSKAELHARCLAYAIGADLAQPELLVA
jgi:hypothetical protein